MADFLPDGAGSPTAGAAMRDEIPKPLPVQECAEAKAFPRGLRGAR